MLSLITLSYLSCGGGPDVKIGVTNQPPSATILSPGDGASFDESSTVNFEAVVNDSFDAAPDLQVIWSSDLDGELVGGSAPSADGSLLYSTANLTPNIHNISLTVFDSDGASGSASIQLEIIDLPDDPTVEILSPSGPEQAIEGQAFEFLASLWDARGDFESLELTVSSDLDGELCVANANADGLASCTHAFVTPGEHYLEFTALNSYGYDATESIYLTVIALADLDQDGDGFTGNQGDCDDGNPTIYPSAQEIANFLDDDCDGIIDEGTENYDDDGDGFSENNGDCDDEEASINPLGTEVENDLDDNCNGIIDEGTNAYDDDGDGLSENDGDCNDTNPDIHPGATEEQNNIDDDCDGLIDEGTNAYDGDGDCFCGLESGSCVGSSSPQCTTIAAGDCNDGNATVYPAAPETPNNVDDDCDGTIDEGTTAYDDDGDCYCEIGIIGVCTGSINASCPDGILGGDCNDAEPNIKPDITEICGDGIDNNCNGSENELDATNCTTFYRDSDRDGYGDSVPDENSVILTECWCEPGGTDGEFDVTNADDCFDGNAQANPNQTGYFDVNRGDGSFDYNCDGSQTQQDTASGECASGLDAVANGFSCKIDRAGWHGSIPACGGSQNYIADDDSCSAGCEVLWVPTCCQTGGPSYGSRTQACR